MLGISDLTCMFGYFFLSHEVVYLPGGVDFNQKHRLAFK